MFGSLGVAPERGFTAQDRAISDRMLDIWANFVKSGNPNDAGASAWRRADMETPVFMELGDAFAPREPLPANIRSFWNTQYDARGEYRF